MKKLLIIALLVVGCQSKYIYDENYKYPDGTIWVRYDVDKRITEHYKIIFDKIDLSTIPLPIKNELVRMKTHEKGQYFFKDEFNDCDTYLSFKSAKKTGLINFSQFENMVWEECDNRGFEKKWVIDSNFIPASILKN